MCIRDSNAATITPRPHGRTVVDVTPSRGLLVTTREMRHPDEPACVRRSWCAHGCFLCPCALPLLGGSTIGDGVSRGGSFTGLTAPAGDGLSLIHISEPTRLLS